MNYYNEIDKGARKWLSQLIKDGLIADGYIDNRPVQEVRADELTRAGFIQCHFFAGIGGWPLAFRLAGIPDDEPWWSGSCPCQPFSDAGEQVGNADPRHLFPTWRRLIARCGPPRVVGEQVASKLGREWLARVRLEMASLGYATRGTDLCSAGVAAPNRRQRLYWLADAVGERCAQRNGGADRLSEKEPQRLREAGAVAHSDRTEREPEQCAGDQPVHRGGRAPDAMDDPHGQRFQERTEPDRDTQQSGEQPPRRPDAVRCGEAGWVGDANDARGEGRRLRSEQDSGQRAPWASGVVGLRCSDGDTRRIKPGIFPLAPRLPGDLALIRGAGNAINPWVAAEFLRDAI